MSDHFRIVNFHAFRDLGTGERLVQIRSDLRAALDRFGVCGTVILAAEGINASLSGTSDAVDAFISHVEALLKLSCEAKTSFNASSPFRKREVKIKPEIVTLKAPVDVALGEGTHVDPEDWNAVISDPDVLVLDARNDYEYRTGTFRRALNPETSKFSELPRFVDHSLDPERHTKVAMFCTGGIRCEKFAAYMKAKGFREVYQLRGGILKYLEVVPSEEQLWEGECFVFDERVTLNDKLQPGSGVDLSMRRKGKKAG